MENNKLNKKDIKQKWLWQITIFALIVFASVLGFIIFKYVGLFYGKILRYETVKMEEKCSNCVRRFLDGVLVEPGKDNFYPVSVVIENHIEARPQYGIADANLVYEAEAEGGITRFLAFFSSGEKLEKIGPVRSARPYFVDWAREFSALFAHCGGSPEALEKIAEENVFDMNEFYQGDYFWRDEKTVAPHNIFTSGDLINKYFNFKNLKEGKFLSWQFKDDALLAERPEKSEIKIDFQFKDYGARWVYDRASNEYVRYTGGELHKDASGKEIRAKNIIVEYVSAKIIDDKLRLKMDHIGMGKSLVCLDGKCEEGEWRKKTSVGRTRFFGEEGDASTGSALREFKLNAGTTWVEVVRPEYNVSY